MVVRDLHPLDLAAITVSYADSEVEAESCQFEYITSNYGYCCFWIQSRKAFFQNMCFSDLFPHYRDNTNQGGSCLALNSVSDATVRLASVSNVSFTYKEMYATFAFYQSKDEMRDVNQTNCSCMNSAGFTCGFYYRESALNDRYIKISDTHGDIVMHYSSLCESSTVEFIAFERVSAFSGMIYMSSATNPLEINSGTAKDCSGVFVNKAAGTLTLRGWYSNTPLSGYFTETKTSDFPIPVKVADCDYLFDDEKYERWHFLFSGVAILQACKNFSYSWYYKISSMPGSEKNISVLFQDFLSMIIEHRLALRSSSSLF